MYLWYGICLTNSAIPTLDTVYGHQHWIPEACSQKPAAGSQNLEEEACSWKPEVEACSRKPEEEACSQKPDTPNQSLKNNYNDYERKKVFNP